MRDFSLSIYRDLLDALKQAGYRFQTFQDFLASPQVRVILLRHDVDDRKLNSLEFARIQHEKGIVGSYYFRMVPQSYDEGVIRAIYDMGHEVGYHYEDMDFAKGDPTEAIRLFEKHLEKLRAVVPVSTICMHGSPRSRFDNKDVWKRYAYRDYGIIGEPYFDIDFRRVFYLTDTGRRWNGQAVSVRDKVEDHFGLQFRNTWEIIRSVREGNFPGQAMLNFHPQRWTDDPTIWLAEKYQQKVKNAVKYWLIKLR
ncbi:MAG: hypothetical protein IPH12_12760 [Saprospirales bacterium]|jgi:hypothetical protein|nr:hypothetical protein [Saprospirales bacterium]MBK8921231.1 hypothetical protein [Saprospirales bacterium]